MVAKAGAGQGRAGLVDMAWRGVVRRKGQTERGHESLLTCGRTELKNNKEDRVGRGRR